MVTHSYCNWEKLPEKVRISKKNLLSKIKKKKKVDSVPWISAHCLLSLFFFLIKTLFGCDS